MSFELTIPHAGGPSQTVLVNNGQSLFVLGANGTGKSSLMHRFYTAHHQSARRISAHRQTWFESNSSNLSSSGKRTTEHNMKASDNQPLKAFDPSMPNASRSLLGQPFPSMRDNIMARAGGSVWGGDIMQILQVYGAGVP